MLYGNHLFSRHVAIMFVFFSYYCTILQYINRQLLTDIQAATRTSYWHITPHSWWRPATVVLLNTVPPALLLYKVSCRLFFISLWDVLMDGTPQACKTYSRATYFYSLQFKFVLWVLIPAAPVVCNVVVFGLDPAWDLLGRITITREYLYIIVPVYL